MKPLLINWVKSLLLNRAKLLLMNRVKSLVMKGAKSILMNGVMPPSSNPSIFLCVWSLVCYGSLPVLRHV